MKLKRILATLLLAEPLAWAFSAQVYDYNGVTVTAESGLIQKIGDELVVTFNQVGTGKLTLDGYALARVMVVGGGGSGSTGRKATSGTGLDYRGNGGSGGEAVIRDKVYLAAKDYTVVVGTGGEAVEPGSTSKRTAGNKGGDSSFAGIIAKGGDGGAIETSGSVSALIRGWGSNLTTDISGSELAYSEGGAASTSATTAGSKGADRGYGGGGGGRTTTAKSGAGGKGVVVVRIKAASANPPATAEFDQLVQYVAGTTVSPFDSIPEWAATITGATNATQRGRFKFTVSLKEGYVWSDTFGHEPRTFNWAVVDDPEAGDNLLDVEKGVRADVLNPSNATISIIGHVPSEKVTANVLFLGTMCYAHSLKPKTIADAINSIAEKGNVDWYLYHKQDLVGQKGVIRNYATDKVSEFKDNMTHTNLCGTVKKGGVIDDNFVRNELDRQMQSNNHQALNSFMERLYEISANSALSNKYDYIVLEFDGSRVADAYDYTKLDTTAAKARQKEAAVAAFLKPYYENRRVVWLVDNKAANEGVSGQVEPWDSEYYRPNLYFHNKYNNTLTEDEYRGLIGLLDPKSYSPTKPVLELKVDSKDWTPTLCLLQGSGSTKYCWYDNGNYTSTGNDPKKRSIYANDKCEDQIPYHNAEDVCDYLSQTIQEKPYDLEFIDKIVDSGLEITAVHMYTSNVERVAEDLGWCEVNDPSVVSIDINHAAHSVNAVVSNMCSEVWAKLDIDVRDTGSFRAGAEPVRDTEGRLVATSDPNDGSCFVFKYDPGDDEPTAQGESPTLEPWTYNVYTVTGLVVNGTLQIDGVETNEAFKAEGHNCHVTYEPNEGYELDSISVDGATLSDAEFAEFQSAYEFEKITANHEIVVRYKSRVLGLNAHPVEAYFNKERQNITFAVTNAAGEVITPDPEKTKVYYKGPDDADWVPAEEFAGISNVTKAAGSSDSNGVVTVEVKVLIEGYEDVTSSSTVRVMPRVIAQQAGSAEKPYDGTPLTCTDHSPDWEAATNYAYEIYHEVKHPEIYDGPPRDDWADAIGFPPGDGLGDVPMTGSQTDVGSSPNTVDLDRVTFTGGANKDDYALSFPTGTLTVVAAAIDSKTPGDNSAANPGDAPADDEPATLWAENVVKVYDGLGTNVVADVYNEVDGNGFTFLYSTNNVDFVAWNELQFTNVVEAQKVYFRAIPQGDVPNYVGTNGYAYVTITNRPVTVAANDTNMLFNAGVPDPTWAGGEGLVEGHFLDVRLSYTNDPNYAVGTYPDAITTNRLIAVTNAAGADVTFDYLVSFVPGTLAVGKAALAVTASDVIECYDGTTHRLADYAVADPRTGDPVTPVAISNSADGVAWYLKDDFPLYVNATNAAPVHVAVVADNYETFVSSGPLATVTVTQRVVTVTLNDANRTYGAATPAWTVKGADGLVGTDSLTGDPGAIVGDEPAAVAGSPHEVTVDPGTLTAGPNYTVVVRPAKLGIVPAPIWPEAAGVGTEYDGEPHSATFVFTPSVTPAPGDTMTTNYWTGPLGTPADSSDWVSCGTENWAQTDVTNMSVRAEISCPNGNFIATNVVADIVITPRVIADGVGGRSAVRANDTNMVFNADVPVPTWAGGEGLVEGHFLDVRLSYTNDPNYAVGTYPDAIATNRLIAVTNAAGADVTFDYLVSFVPGELTVGKAALAVTASDVTECYDGTTHRLQSYDIADPRTGDPVTPVAISNSADGVAWYLKDDFPLYVNATNAAPVHVAVVADNYETFVSSGPLATVTVTQRVVTVTLAPTNKTYGAATPAWTVASTSGLVGDDPLAGAPGAIVDGEPTDVSGSPHAVTVDPGALSAGDNYTVVVAPAQLTIDPAPIEPEATGVGVEYDGEPHSAEFTFTPSATPAPDDLFVTNYFTGPCGTPADSSDWTACGTENWAQTDVTNMSVKAVVSCPNGNFISTNVVVDIVITPRVIADGTEGRSAVRANDTNMLFNAGVPVPTWRGGDGLVPGHFLDVRLSYTNDPNYAAGVYPDAVATNALIAVTNAAGEDVTFNYAVSFVPGALTVAKDRGYVEPIDPVPYKGEAWEPVVTVTNAQGGTLGVNTDYTVRYFDNTNATDAAYAEVTFVGNYEGVATNYFTIEPKTVTLASGSETFTYDGNPHAYTNLTATGFVAGEGLSTTSDWATVTNVAEGEVDNTFVYTLADGTLAENYVITVETGRLSVVAAPVPAPDGPGDGVGPYTEDPEAPPPDPSAYGGDLSDYDVTVCYDGGGHTFDTNALYEVLATNELFRGNHPVVTYSLDGSEWTDGPYLFTNVVSTSFWYRVETPNYSNYVHAAGVTVTQRVVEVTSGTEEWTYDGQAHSNLTVTVTKGSFAPGEGISTNDFTTITEVGTKDNAFTVTWNEGTDPANYSFSVVTGELVVVAQAVPSYEIASIEWYHNRADGLYYPRIVVRYLAGDASRLVGVSFACDGEMHELPASCVAELKTATVSGQEFVFGVDTNKFPVSYNRTKRDGYIIWNTAEERERAMLFGEYKTVRPLTLELEVQGTVRIPDEEIPARFEEFRVGDQKIFGKVSTEPGARVRLYGCSAIGGEWVLVCELQMDEEGRFEVEMPAGLSFFRLEGGHAR